MNNKGKIAITQISILVIGIIAFAFMIGSIPFGSAYIGPEGFGSSWLSDKFGTGLGGWGDSLSTGLQWAAIAYASAYLLGPMLGLDDRQTEILAGSAAAGFGLTAGIVAGFPVQSLTSLQTFGIGLVVTLAIYYFSQESYKVVKFSCNAWDAQTGGENCELCNNQILPCSEYQCRSLGQGCELINQGSDEEQCVWINRNDIEAPVIQPWNEALEPDFDYTPDNAVSPPDRGVQIVYPSSSDRCIPAFTPLKFGVVLNEPGKCRVDLERKATFEDMGLELSNGLSKYNHTIQFSLPGMENLEQEGLELENDGDYELYIRCEDANGNGNTANFVFKYCVDKGPDTTAPRIEDTSVLNNMPVAFDQDALDVTFYVNEPADCKWSHQDESYENMQNNMNCVDTFAESIEYNAQIVYPCSTTLSGIQNQQINEFYVRCEDQPLLSGTENENDRNMNTESYKYNVIGTQTLVIDEASPNETEIKDSATDIKVTLTAKTSAGFNEGESICYYAESGDDNYIKFFNTESYTHSTDLYLEEGEYEYKIKCVDLGGNSDIVSIEFETESDSEAPMIVRAYKSDNSLKIVSDEPAQCVYDTVSCNYLFIDGIPMITTEDSNHFVDWSTKTKFYIKCKDKYGNEPNANECSSIVRTID